MNPNHDASAKCAANARFLSLPKTMKQRILFVETGTIFKQSIKANEAEVHLPSGTAV